MGGCCTKHLQYDSIKQGSEVQGYSNFTQDAGSWKMMKEEELKELLNQLHLTPFEENRKQLLLSLQCRLLTCADLCQILELLSSDQERQNILTMLNGNVQDNPNNWKLVVGMFSDSKIVEEVKAFIAPRRKESRPV